MNLRTLYEQLFFFQNLCLWNEKIKNKIIELKREIRVKNKYVSPYKLISCDYNYDSYKEIFTFPVWVATKEEAENYFNTYEYKTCKPSQYDCTGQHFTTYYKIFFRNGRWKVYHCVSVDV